MRGDRPMARHHHLQTVYSSSPLALVPRSPPGGCVHPPRTFEGSLSFVGVG